MDKNPEAAPKSGRILESQSIPLSECVLPDGSLLELIRPSSENKEAALLYCHNEQCMIEAQHIIGPHRYVPTQAANMVRHLPTKPIPYGSTQELFRDVSEFIATSSGLRGEELELLPFICFASFFAPWLSCSPCLSLFGSPVQAVSFLRVLGCVCHHPVLLADCHVLGLPRELRPTRLICQSDSGLDKLLGALQFSGFGISGKEFRELTATTVVYVGETNLKSPFADVGFWFAVPPAISLFSVG